MVTGLSGVDGVVCGFFSGTLVVGGGPEVGVVGGGVPVTGVVGGVSVVIGVGS
jgi:hypothetical protein